VFRVRLRKNLAQSLELTSMEREPKIGFLTPQNTPVEAGDGPRASLEPERRIGSLALANNTVRTWNREKRPRLKEKESQIVNIFELRSIVGKSFARGEHRIYEKTVGGT